MVSWDDGIFLNLLGRISHRSSSIDINSLLLVSKIKVVSLFTMIYHGLHEIHARYFKEIIIITYTYEIMVMVGRGEALGEPVPLRMVGKHCPMSLRSCIGAGTWVRVASLVQVVILKKN